MTLVIGPLTAGPAWVDGGDDEFTRGSVDTHLAEGRKRATTYVDRSGSSSYVDSVTSDEMLMRLIKRHGIRRALTLFGAAGIAAARGWEVMIGDDAYSRQGVWTWKRDLDLAGIDPATVKWSGFERKLGSDLSHGLVGAKERLRQKKAAREARSARGRAST